MIILGPVAIAKNWVIGSENDLPWYLPEDLKHFRQITTGKVCLMGRKTFESILRRLGKPLPNRLNVVVTRESDYKAPPGVIVYHDLKEALADYNDKELYIIGGSQIFEQTIGLAEMMHITHVEIEAKGDSFFPAIDWDQWDRVEEEKHENFAFAVYRRIGAHMV